MTNKLDPNKLSKIIPKYGSSCRDANDESLFKELVNRTLMVRSCSTCIESKWSADLSTVHCQNFNASPPAWAIAGGCDSYDNLPF